MWFTVRVYHYSYVSEIITERDLYTEVYINAKNKKHIYVLINEFITKEIQRQKKKISVLAISISEKVDPPRLLADEARGCIGYIPILYEDASYAVRDLKLPKNEK